MLRSFLRALAPIVRAAWRPAIELAGYGAVVLAAWLVDERLGILSIGVACIVIGNSRPRPPVDGELE